MLKPIEFHARLLNYRDYLIEQRSELEKKMIAKVLQDTNLYKKRMRLKKSEASKKSKTNSTNSTSERCAHNTQNTEWVQDKKIDTKVESQDETTKISQHTMDTPEPEFEIGAETKVSSPNSKDTTRQIQDFGQNAEAPVPDQSSSIASDETLTDSTSNTPTQSDTETSAKSTGSTSDETAHDSNASTVKDSNPNETASDNGASTASTKRTKRNKRDKWSTHSTNTSRFPKMDATHVSRVTTDVTPQDKHALIRERLPKALTTCEFTVRTRRVGKYFKLGIQTCARMLINLIREVDPYMTVIPAEEEGALDSDDYITHEDDFDGNRYTT